MKGDIFKDFAVDGVLKTPLFMVLTPKQEVVGKYLEEAGWSQLVGGIKKAKKQLGRGLTEAEFEQQKETVATIQNAIRAKDYRRAYNVVLNASPLPSSFPIQQAFNDERRKLLDLGQQLLDEANALWTEGQHFQAMSQADLVAYSFGKSDIGKSSSKTLKAWEKTEEGKPHAKLVATNGKARALFDQGVDYEREGEDRRALSRV